VLEGSVRTAAIRVRITGELIDATTGTHLWADRFEGTLDDIFALQDRVAESVVGAIVPQLEQAEIERMRRKPTESLGAYDYYLRGLASLNEHPSDPRANRDALELFTKAIELDPNFAAAYGMAAWCYVWRKSNGWMINRAQEIAEAERLARRAVELGKDDAVAPARGGHALAFVVSDLDAGVSFIDRALVINPNLAVGWYLSGWARMFLGEPELAVDHFDRAIRLSPLDPMTFAAQTGYAHACFCAGRYDEASSWAQKSLHSQPNFMATNRIAAASFALAGRITEAQQITARLRQLDPALRVSNLKDQIPLRRSDDLIKYQEGLRKAGLPE
jgi:tetratricopeptide (TPR) repeat protein